MVESGLRGALAAALGKPLRGEPTTGSYVSYPLVEACRVVIRIGAGSVRLGSVDRPLPNELRGRAGLARVPNHPSSTIGTRSNARQISRSTDRWSPNSQRKTPPRTNTASDNFE